MGISSTSSGYKSVRMYRENQMDHEYSVYVIITMEEDSLSNDNKSVVVNTTIPSSALKKKHCAVAYHQVCEAVAATT